MYFAHEKDVNLGGTKGHNIMDPFVSPQNLYIEALTTNVTVFGDRVSKEVTG